jgi:hypothetical protein
MNLSLAFPNFNAWDERGRKGQRFLKTQKEKNGPVQFVSATEKKKQIYIGLEVALMC